MENNSIKEVCNKKTEIVFAEDSGLQKDTKYLY